MDSKQFLSDVVVYSKYAKYNSASQRRENWAEIIQRNADMHAKRYPQISDEIYEVYANYVIPKKVFPSMRALENSTPIRTKNGWTTAGEIVQGDILYDSLGKETNVVDIVSFTDKELFELTFSDNSTLVACDEHLWIISTRDDLKYKKAPRVVDTKFIREHIMQGNRSNIIIHNPLAIEFDEQVLTIDPYILGQWLGDGYSNGCQLSMSVEDAPFTLNEYHKCEYDTTPSDSSNIWTHSVRGLREPLTELNLIQNKHIPRQYLTGTITQRLNFIQGLMDSDGHVTPEGRCLFSNTNENIIDGVTEILSSLGIKYTIILSKKEKEHHLQLFNISFFTSLPVVRMPRKLKNIREYESIRVLRRSVKSVRNVGIGNASCFHVDSHDHSFLAGKNMIVTHNSLQFAGKAIEVTPNRIFNCSFSAADNPAIFSETMFNLLGGCGVGISVQKHHVEQLPPIKQPTNKRHKRYLIPDSIEGWSEAIKMLMKSYFNGSSRVVFDYSDIRPKGTELVTAGGLAPGPAPLKECIDILAEKLDAILENNGGVAYLKSIEVHDIICFISNSVLAGGIRRSALISMFSADDIDMLTCKSNFAFETTMAPRVEGYNIVLEGTYNGRRKEVIIGNDQYNEYQKTGTLPWYIFEEQRGRANNSIVLEYDKITREDFDDIWERIENSKAGEPGVYWTNDRDLGTNPCFTGDTIVAIADGRIGVTIEELALESNGEISFPVYSGKSSTISNQYEDSGKFEKWTPEIKHAVAFKTGDKPTVEVVMGDGTSFKCTEDHQLAKPNGGYVEALYSVGETLEGFCTYAPKENPIVVSVEYTGDIESVYDLTVEDNRNFYILTNVDEGYKNSTGILVHNCCEISLKSNGYCNLTSIVADGVTTQDDYNARARAGAFIGTLQAGYTNFHYLRDEWQDNAEDESLLGVSMTGIASGDILNLNMVEAAKCAANENERIADLIGINKAKRVTTVKPEGCRPNYAITTTEKGILTLDELLENHVDGSQWSEYTGHNNVIQTDTNNTITKTFDNGESDIYVAELAGQIEIESTPDHPWFVSYNYNQQTRKKTYINTFIPMKDLSVGDVLDITLGVYNNTDNKELKSLNTFSYKMRGGYNIITQPTHMSMDLAWLIGYLWGDGSLSPHKYRLRFTDENMYNLLKAQTIINDLFGVESFICDCTNSKAKELYVANRSLFNWLAHNGVRKYSNDGLDYIPMCVRESSKNDIIAFIAGFSDADGCIHEYKNNNTYKLLMISQTYNSGFTRHLQNVAMAVGLHFSHSHNTRGDSFSKDKNMVLMALSAYSLHESVTIFEANSNKCANVLTDRHLRSNADVVRQTYKFGMVKSVKFDRVDITYDIAVANDHWYYAGAIKSHNTASIVAGTSSGIHAWHAPYYIRRMRINKDEAIYKYLVEKLPSTFIEDDVFSPNTTAVLAMPIKAPEDAIFRDESPIDLMERVKKVHDEWIANEFTHREGVNTHNVSVTVSIDNSQWEDVGNWMWDNRYSYHGISVLPLDAGTYLQMPFTDSTKEEYESMIAELDACGDINLDDIIEERDTTDLSGESACSGGGCEISAL